MSANIENIILRSYFKFFTHVHPVTHTNQKNIFLNESCIPLIEHIENDKKYAQMTKHKEG